MCQNLTNFVNFYRANAHHVKQCMMVSLLRQSGYTMITAPTLSSLIKNESSICSYVQAQHQQLYKKCTAILTLLEVDSALAQWTIQQLEIPARLSSDVLCETARDFCHLLGIPDNTLAFSQGWL
jgi:hypothetical protein